MFNTEEDDDFTPVASSKLASLFGKSTDPGNTSLVYTAPKQPKKNQPMASSPASSQQASNPPKLNIIVVNVVQTFKLEDGNYNSQGKLGAAVLGCPTSRMFQLLLYRNKQQQITTTKITENFKFTVQPNNYASFYDDQRQNWSILFDSEKDVAEFAKQVGIARACSYRDEAMQPFYAQDLRLGGDGSAAEIGDLLEVRYTTNALIDCSIGQEIENNLKAEKPQRVKIRKGVWEEALLAILKGGKRLIILAPDLFGPWKPQALPNSRLVVEVEIVRIKSAKRSREPTPTRLKHLAESSESNVDSSTDETSIKARGASISEALTNSPKTHKASIISRMARMGQATLPLKGAVVCNPSDSEETEEEGAPSGGSSSITSKPVAKTRTPMPKLRASRQEPPAVATTSTTSAPVAQQLTVFSQATPWQQPQHPVQPATHMMNGVPFNVAPQYNHFSADGQMYPAITMSTVAPHQLFPAPANVGTPPDSHFAVFISESRAQSAELRMGMNKITDKVDQVISKVDGLQQQQQQQQQQLHHHHHHRALLPGALATMEPTVLLASIQKLVSDHEQLQTELVDKRAKLEQQNEKMFHLLHANQKLMEQSNNMMEQRQDSSLQTTILILQEEKGKLIAELKEAMTKIQSLQEDAGKFRRVDDEQREETTSLTTELCKYKVELENCHSTVLELEKKLSKSDNDLKAAIQMQQLQESSIANLKVNQIELQSAKVLLEESLSETHRLLEQKKKEVADLAASCEESEEKLNSHPAAGDSVLGEDVNILRNQLSSQIQELTVKHAGIVENLEKDKTVLQERVKQLQEHLQDSGLSMKGSAADVAEDVKKIMNVMYRLLKSEFEPGTSYEGGVIMQILLATIKDVTLQYLNKISSGKTIPSQDFTGQTNQSRGEIKNKLVPPESVEVEDISLKQTQLSVEEPNGEKPKKSSIHVEHIPKSNQEINNSPIEISTTQPQGNLLATSSLELGIKQSRDSSLERGWRPQPPPSPLFDDEDDDDDWLH